MAQNKHAPRIGWGRTAWYGAEAGLALAFLYALAFIGYAIVRSTLNLLAAPNRDGGLAGTLVATWIALALPAFVVAALAGILAAIIGALTALALRALLSRMNAAHTPRRAIAIGVGVCLTVSLTLLVVLTQGLGLTWTPVVAMTLTFWLVLPLATYVVAGGVASWQVNRMMAA
jgi:hypothetical protein